VELLLCRSKKRNIKHTKTWQSRTPRHLEPSLRTSTSNWTHRASCRVRIHEICQHGSCHSFPARFSLPESGHKWPGYLIHGFFFLNLQIPFFSLPGTAHRLQIWIQKSRKGPLSYLASTNYWFVTKNHQK
jgi:hypothetical protein